MKIKTKINKIPLYIGIILIAFSEFVRFLLPEVDLNSVSPYEAYQQLSAEQFWIGMTLLGWSVCIIWVLVFFVSKLRRKNECKKCGAEVKRKDDVFCRECGAKL